MSSKEKKSRKMPDEEETKKTRDHKKPRTGEHVEGSTTKQPVPCCSSTTVNNEDSTLQNSRPTLEINASKTSASSTEDNKSESEKREEYETGRLKNLLHGISYQLMLLIYFTQRGLEKREEDEQYSFALATEMKFAEDFDDVVFRHRENNGKWKYHFLQAKHKDNDEMRITLTDLLRFTRKNDGTKNQNNDFGLQKYFESFLKIKQHSFFKDTTFGNFIICTNIGLENYEYFNPVEENDEILHFKEKNAKLLKLDLEKFPKKEKLRSILEQTPHYASENEITDFFDKLVFAVGMPNEARLSKIIAENMSQQFNLKDSKLATNHSLRLISKWMNSKKAYFFKNECGKTCYEKIKLKIQKLEVYGITYEYCEGIKKYGIEFDNIPSKLSNFLNCIEEQIFILISPLKTTRLSAIKLINALKDMDEYQADDSFISMYLSSVWSTLDLVKSTFESKRTYNLLVVECEDEIKYDKERLFKTLTSVVEKRSEKKNYFHNS